MQLTFKEIEYLLFTRYGLSASRAVAFRGRLQHLQRSGFPTGVNTGKGKRASYGWNQLIELSTVLDLIDLGLTPDVAIRLISTHRQTLFLTVSGFVVQASRDELMRAAMEMRCSASKRMMLCISGHVFSEDDYVTVTPCSAQAIAQRLHEEDTLAGFGEITLDVTGRLITAISMLTDAPEHPLDQVVLDLERWAHGVADELVEAL